jgi:hypothetical protein
MSWVETAIWNGGRRNEGHGGDIVPFGTNQPHLLRDQALFVWSVWPHRLLYPQITDSHPAVSGQPGAASAGWSSKGC